MKGLPYYRAFPRDFFEATIGMPGEMKCAYRLVLDLIYMQGGNLPDDGPYIAGLLGYSVRKWRTIRQFLIDAKKIQIAGDFITNERATTEVDSLSEYRKTQSNNAKGRNHNKGQKSDETSDQNPDKKPKDPPKKPAKPKPVPDPDVFDRFWSVVPRKVAKAAAEKSFKAALKKAKAEVIIAGMQRYASQKRGEPDRYIAHPSTWLNAERWNDPTEKLNPQPGQGTNDDKRKFDAAHREYARRVGAGEINPGPDPSDPFAGG